MRVLFKLILIIIAATAGWLGFQKYKSYTCEDYNGMGCRNIRVSELANWPRDANLLVERGDNELLIQEDVAGEGGYLHGTDKLKSNFLFKFDFKNWAEATKMRIQMVDRGGQEIVMIEMIPSSNQTQVILNKNNQPIGSTVLTALSPDLFYEFRIEKIGNDLNLYFDGGVVLQTVDTTSFPQGTMVLSIEGQKFKPAGISLRNMRIYQ